MICCNGFPPSTGNAWISRFRRYECSVLGLIRVAIIGSQLSIAHSESFVRVGLTYLPE